MAFALVFDSVGAGEWLLLLAVLLVVVGPKRLPGMLRNAGNHYAKFRRMADNFRRQLMDMDTEFERAVNAAEREAASGIPDITDLNPTPATDTPSDEESPKTSENAEKPATPESPKSTEPKNTEKTETPEAWSADENPYVD